MATWEPQATSLQQLILLLQDFQSHDNRIQRLAVDRLFAYSQTEPEFWCYLVYIFAYSTLDFHQRNKAGLLLKNQLSTTTGQPHFEFIKAASLRAVKDPLEQIRNVAGTLITTIYEKGESQWPNLIPTLISLFDDPDGQEGAFGAISKICEDSTNVLVSNEIISILIPKLVLHMSSPNVKIRRYVCYKCEHLTHEF